MRLSYFCYALACGLSEIVWARDVKFKVGAANQCDPLIIEVAAGVYAYPLVLTVTPFEHRPLNITVEQDSNGPNAARNITIPQLPWEEGRQILVTLSDRTGFASGGTSEPLVLGPSQTGTKCNVTLPTLDFFFSLDSPLVQCQPYPIDRFTKATQPVKFFFQIPSGDSFALQAPVSSLYSFDWLPTFKAGTPIVFTMIDAVGGQGGSSNARVVGDSNNSSCLSNHSKRRLSAGAIAGIVIGIIVLIFSAVIAFFLRKRKRSFYPFNSKITENNQESDLLPSQYPTAPFILETRPGPTSKRASTPTTPTAVSPITPTSASTQSRLIVHRDITEQDEEDEHGVVELPPQYSERRAPIPGISTPSTTTASGSSARMGGTKAGQRSASPSPR